MSILSMLSRNRPQAPPVEAERECGHWELAPRWSCNEDIGKESKVTYYTCNTCGAPFSPEEAAEIRST
jgi:hypothetical protein